MWCSARALFGSCRYIVEDLLPRLGIATALIDGRDLAAWETAVPAQHPRSVLRDADQPGARAVVDIEGVCEDRQEGHGGGRQCVRHAAAPAADAARRSIGRPESISTARACLGGVVLAGAVRRGELREIYCKHQPSLSPFNPRVLLKGLETLFLRVAQHGASAASLADFSWPTARSGARVLSRPRPIIRNTRSPQTDGRRRPMVAFEVKGDKAAAAS